MEAKEQKEIRHDRMNLTDREAFIIYELLIVCVIAIGAAIAFVIMYLFVSAKTMYIKNPLLTRYALGIVNILWAMRINHKAYDNLNNYIVIDSFFIKNLLYFLLSILAIVGTIFYLAELLLS